MLVYQRVSFVKEKIAHFDWSARFSDPGDRLLESNHGGLWWDVRQGRRGRHEEVHMFLWGFNGI